MVKHLRKSYESVFICQTSIFCRYCIQSVKDGSRIQIRVYTTNKESETHFSQFISGKVRKNLRKSHAQFWDK